MIGIAGAGKCSGLFVIDVSEVAIELASTAAVAGFDERGLVTPNGVCVAVTEAAAPVSGGAFDGPLSEEGPIVAASLISAVAVVVACSSSILIRLFDGSAVDNEALPAAIAGVAGASITPDNGFRFKVLSCPVIGTCSVLTTVEDAFKLGSTVDAAFASSLPPSCVELASTSIAFTSYRVSDEKVSGTHHTNKARCE